MLVSRRLRERARIRTDEGAALVAVVVVMLVGVIAASAITASVVFAMSSNLSNAARTQAFISAESGRDMALTELMGDLGACAESYDRTDEPKYSVKVFHADGAVKPISSDQAIAGCPTNNSTFVLLRSTGTGPNDVTVTVETVYPLLRADSSANDMEFYHGATFDAGINLTGTTSGDPMSVMVVAGDWTCRTTVQGNVTVGGNIVGNGNCRIQGDVHAKGNLTVQTGDVLEGNVTTAGTGTATINGKVLGNLWVGGGINFGWTGFTFPGNVKAAGAVNFSNVTLAKKLTLPTGTSLQRDGYINISAPTATDARILGGIQWTASAERPAAPEVSAWHEFKYIESEWPGYTNKITLVNSGSGPGTCNYFNANNPSTGNAKGWRDLADLTTPTVLDARACSSLSSNNGSHPDVTIKTDLLVLAKSYDLRSLTIRAAAGTTPKVWLTVEDPNSADDLPTCSGGAGNIAINATALVTPVQAMAYTPCTIDVKGTTGTSQWTGAFYSGNFTYGGGLTFTGDKSIGLPGMTSDTGANGGLSLGARLWQSEVQ